MFDNDREAQRRHDEDAVLRAARDQEVLDRRREDDDKKRDDEARDEKERARTDADKRKADAAKEREEAVRPIRDDAPRARFDAGAREVEANRIVAERFDNADHDRALEDAFEKSGFHRAGRTDDVAMAEQRRILTYGAEAERNGYAEPSQGEDGPEQHGRGEGPETHPGGPEDGRGPLETAGARRVREVPDFEALENDARMAREREEQREPHERA